MSFEFSPYETSSVPTRVYQPSELLDEILLASVVGVGPNIAQSLLETFGSAGETLRASLSDLLSVPHVGKNLAQSIRNARNTVNPEEIAQFCEKNNISVLTQRDSRYPARLRTLDAPPQLLYVRGALLEKDARAIAVVGTRGVTEYGTRHAKRIVSNLAENGFTIISGLALGVDGIAHRVALDVGGRTIAVLGTGVANIYPKEHEDLAARIINNGALVSEYYPTTKPFRGNFPARNRIISALSIGVLVVESGTKGGSMITARFALEQGRDLFAIPGPIDSKQSQGSYSCRIRERYLQRSSQLWNQRRRNPSKVVRRRPFRAGRARGDPRRSKFDRAPFCSQTPTAGETERRKKSRLCGTLFALFRASAAASTSLRDGTRAL